MDPGIRLWGPLTRPTSPRPPLAATSQDPPNGEGLPAAAHRRCLGRAHDDFGELMPLVPRRQRLAVHSLPDQIVQSLDVLLCLWHVDMEVDRMTVYERDIWVGVHERRRTRQRTRRQHVVSRQQNDVLARDGS